MPITAVDPEAWHVEGAYDTILEAVEAREVLLKEGGTVLIFEHQPAIGAYAQAYRYLPQVKG